MTDQVSKQSVKIAGVVIGLMLILFVGFQMGWFSGEPPPTVVPPIDPTPDPTPEPTPDPPAETPVSEYGIIQGKVINIQGSPVKDASVNVEGLTVTATTDADGVFELKDVEPGFAYVYVSAPSDAYLDGETLSSVYVGADSTVSGVEVTLSGRPSDTAEYVGMDTCVVCHGEEWADIFEAFDGSAESSIHSRFVTVGTSHMVYPEMWPAPGAKNLVPLDPSGEPLMVQDPLDGEGLVNLALLTTDGEDGREYWFKFFPQLAEGASPMTMADMERNTGTPVTGTPATANDPVWIPISATIGGEGNWGEGYVDPNHMTEDNPTNFGEGKQRWLCKIDDVPYLVSWMTEHGISVERGQQDYVSYLPVYLMQDGTPVGSDALAEGDFGTPKFWQKGPTHWCPPTNTLSRNCVGCHTTGSEIEYETIVDGDHTYKAVVTAFDYKDLDVTCERCHRPGSEHVSGERSNIITPQYLSAEASNELCGQCHASHSGKSMTPEGIFKYPYDATYEETVGNGYFVPGIHALETFYYNYNEASVNNQYTEGTMNSWADQEHNRAHSGMLPELLRSPHVDNPYQKLTCYTCHDSHTLDVVPTLPVGEYEFERPAYDDNTLCLGCHAGHGPFADVTKDDVAAMQVHDGRQTTKDGVVITFEVGEIAISRNAVTKSVGAHMAEIGMGGALYTPDDPDMSVGSCVSCHMAQIGKLFDLNDDAQYHLDFDAEGLIAVAEGNVASHVFDIVWPSQSAILVNPDRSLGHDYDIMPNSCSNCHAYARISGDLD
ncbi:carboxypeptidase regulatory-like domain-containing protein [Candidatus Bathyarchaeota archaeon]|nr:carboxypeptidase regulatory-like domain-containing protein [Candidatus Bathyarchaeota archaeon]